MSILKKAREKQLSNEKNHLLKRMDELVNMVAQNNQKQEEINAKIDRTEATVNRIELNEPADTMAMLKQIDKKVDERDIKFKFLINDCLKQNQKLND